MTTLTANPTAGRMIQGFGPRPKPTPSSPRIHYGQDWGWKDTTTDPIFAAAGGIVASYEDVGAYGRRLVVVHDDGSEAWYCHTSERVVSIGARVRAGQTIARIGMTGNTTGPHLHFELRIDGVAVDPAPYFAGSSTAGEDSTPIRPTSKELPMDRAVIIALEKDGRFVDWSLIGADVKQGPGANDAPGCRVTGSQATANRWARAYGSAVWTTADRDEYIATQAEFRALAASQQS